jgi:hypothetical protein
MDGVGGAVLTAAFFILLQSVDFGEQIAPGVSIPPHDHPPSWAVVFSTFLPAVFVDVAGRLPSWARGAGVGALRSTIFYIASRPFFESQFQYPLSDAFTAVVVASLAGLVAGVAVFSHKGTAQETF